VLLRSTTSARPRVAPPGAPVNGAGMASPTTTKFCSVCARAADGSADAEAATQIMPKKTVEETVEKIADLAKGVHRDCFEPGFRILGFALADLARRIDRACDIAFDLGELAVLWLIKAGQ
jgi:hypothetical protein